MGNEIISHTIICTSKRGKINTILEKKRDAKETMNVFYFKDQTKIRIITEIKTLYCSRLNAMRTIQSLYIIDISKDTRFFYVALASIMRTPDKEE